MNERRWTGQWCWTHKHTPRPWNFYAYFRRTIDLPGRATAAPIRISADARYTLYVNGQRVHLGPARSYPQHQSYDEIDLAPYLTSGRNAICVIVMVFGIPTFQSQYREAQGLIVDGEIHHDAGQSIPLHTPAEWKCREATAWRKDVARLSIMLGFQEHFDADADPPGWMLPDYEPKEADGWKDPMLLGPAGFYPWEEMEERGIPLLAQRVFRFDRVVAQFRGENARGYKVAANVYDLPKLEKHRKDDDLIDAPAAMLSDDDNLTTITPPPEGEYVAVVVDPSQYRTGHLMLDIAEAAGDEIIDILYTEKLDKNDFPHLLGEPGEVRWCQEAIADRYRCRPGAQKWEPFWFKGMRYVTLIFRNVEKPLKIRHVAFRQVHAAVEDAGAFQCSDERLNRLWAVGRETQRNCLFDAFVDCPWREQGQYWGDARVQSRVTAYAFGDYSVLERGIRQMMQSQAKDGSLHAHPPAETMGQRIVDFMLTWVLSLHDHYWFTGRTSALEQSFPALVKLLDEFFKRRETDDGLLSDFPGFWVFLDWADLHKSPYSAVMNLMYLQALRRAADVAQILGEEAHQQRWSQRAAHVEAMIDKFFWDPEESCWRDGFDIAKGERVEKISQQANTLGILLNLHPEHHAAIARERLYKPAKAKRSKIVTGSPFFYAYVLEAMIQAGLRKEAIEIIKQRWGVMLDDGATTFYEIWDPTQGGGSHCHAWSASPLFHLSQQILGAVPAAPGWTKVRIAPLPLDLEFARGTVPTPLGRLRIEWESAGEDQLAVRVDVPAGMDVEFVGPDGTTRNLSAGRNEFQA